MSRKELYEAALKACGGDEFELACRLGFENINTAAREFSRWKIEKGMNFERTLAMLAIAGLLKDGENDSGHPLVLSQTGSGNDRPARI